LLEASVGYFDPGLHEGQILTNDELQRVFRCSRQGGMRRSHKTNSLVLVSKGWGATYHDRWEGSVFHYTGMGLVGDQGLQFAQNKTLAESDANGVAVFLFENSEPNKYLFKGRVRLAGAPYAERQLDIQDDERQVWVFPLTHARGTGTRQLELDVTNVVENQGWWGQLLCRARTLLRPERKP
jgi:5-methylcytosine-specific restriction protein A